MSVTRTNSKIEAEYRARTRRSAELYARARKVIPAGLTHDSRTLLPYPIYAARASGPRKWDVDDNEYVDYFGGHGALLLGHGHPGRGGGDRAPGEARHALGRLARAGGAMGRAGQSPDPLRRARALHRLRHRGLASGAAARPRLYGQAEGHPLRRPLPRLARRRDCGRHVALRGRRAGGHSGRPGRADRPAAGRRRCPRRRHARGARRRGRRHPRAVGCLVGPGAAARGLPRRPARDRRASTAWS